MKPEAELRAVQILARSLFRDLVADGLDARDVLVVAAELIDEVAEHKAERRIGTIQDATERDLTRRLV